MSELSVRQEGFVKQLLSLLPEGSELRLTAPEKRAEVSPWIESAKVVASPLPSQWAQLYRLDEDYGLDMRNGKPKLTQDEDGRIFRAQLTVQKAEWIIDYFKPKPATEAMAARLAAIEDRAWDKVGLLDGLRAVDCYAREYAAAQRLEARKVEEMLGLGIDPGADALQHATEGQPDEVEPVSEGSSVNRRKR